MKIIAAASIAFGLSLSGPAVAQTDMQRYCSDLAHFGEAIAWVRDAGGAHHEAASTVEPGPAQNVLNDVVDFVYMPPHLTPNEEATIVFMLCISDVT